MIQELRRSKPFILVVVVLAVFTDAYFYGLITPVLPFSLIEHVGIKHESVQICIGILLGAFGFGLFFGSPVAVYLADKGGNRRMYMWGLIVLALSTILFSVGTSMPVLVFARLIQGASSGMVHIIGTAMVTQRFPNDVGKAIGLIDLALAAGMVLGPFCGGILYHRYGYPAVWVSAYVLIALDFLFRILMVDEPQQPAIPATSALEAPYEPLGSARGVSYGTIQPLSRHDEPTSEPSSDTSVGNLSFERQFDTEQSKPDTALLQERKPPSTKSIPTRSSFFILLLNIRMLAAIVACIMEAFLLTTLESTLPLYLKQIWHYNSQQVGVIFLFVMIAYFLAPAIGALNDRVGARILVVTAYIMLTPLWILLRFIDHNTLRQKVLLCVILTAMGLALNLILTPAFVEAKLVVDEIVEERPGTFEEPPFAMAFALMNMSYAVGMLLGPILGSLLVKTLGWPQSTLLIGISCALCVVPSFYAMGRKEHVKRSNLRDHDRGESQVED